MNRLEFISNTIPSIFIGSSDGAAIRANPGATLGFTILVSCVDSGAKSAANTKSKKSNSPTGFNANKKVIQ